MDRNDIDQAFLRKFHSLTEEEKRNLIRNLKVFLVRLKDFSPTERIIILEGVKPRLPSVKVLREVINYMRFAKKENTSVSRLTG